MLDRVNDRDMLTEIISTGTVIRTFIKAIQRPLVKDKLNASRTKKNKKTKQTEVQSPSE